ncbi:MAG: CDP-glycerol glycerophosphotransferase family protein [Bacteroidaceae bacterium]|nr:CDP-glycerol glycerophosphotransferase family protein [Bacteroidaceae bacterium]
MKFLGYLLCYLIYPFSFLFPRSRKKYAFGSFRGAFNDNAKYLFIYASTHQSDVRCVWLSPDRKTVRQVRSFGLESYNVFSPKGAWHALTSRYWFVNSYSNDIFYSFSGGATIINLWHGLTIKRIEFGITGGDLADRYVRMTLKERYYHPQVYRRPDYVLSSSRFQSEIFAKDFRIPVERCLEFGYPRNWLLRCTAEVRSEFALQYEPSQTREVLNMLKAYSKSYIYMPTWRDSQREVFVQSMNLDALNEVLSVRNELLLLKPHANTRVSGVEKYSNIMLLDNRLDVYSILPDIDVLISDYSSIIQDYLLMPGKGLILYLYDYEDYAKGRDFEIDYDTVMPGVRAYDFDGLVNAVQSDVTLPENDRRRFTGLFWGDSSEMEPSERILEFVKNL